MRQLLLDIKNDPTCSNLMAAADQLYQSKEMQELWLGIDDPNFDAQTKDQLVNMFNTMLNSDIENGMTMFALYLELLAEDPAYIAFKPYAQTLASVAKKVQQSAEYSNYAAEVLQFENNHSDAAETVRNHMASVLNDSRE